MESEKKFIVELILREHIAVKVSARSSLSAMNKLREIHHDFIDQAEVVYESDSHIIVEEPDAGGFSYINLRDDEHGFCCLTN